MKQGTVSFKYSLPAACCTICCCLSSFLLNGFALKQNCSHCWTQSGQVSTPPSTEPAACHSIPHLDISYWPPAPKTVLHLSGGPFFIVCLLFTPSSKKRISFCRGCNQWFPSDTPSKTIWPTLFWKRKGWQRKLKKKWPNTHHKTSFIFCFWLLWSYRLFPFTTKPTRLQHWSALPLGEPLPEAVGTEETHPRRRGYTGIREGLRDRPVRRHLLKPDRGRRGALLQLPQPPGHSAKGCPSLPPSARLPRSRPRPPARRRGLVPPRTGPCQDGAAHKQRPAPRNGTPPPRCIPNPAPSHRICAGKHASLGATFMILLRSGLAGLGSDS